MILVVVILFAVVITLAFWLLYDAQHRRGDNATHAGATGLARIAQDMDDEIALLGGIAKNRPLYPEERYLRSKLTQYRKAMKSYLLDTHSRLAKVK